MENKYLGFCDCLYNDKYLEIENLFLSTTMTLTKTEAIILRDVLDEFINLGNYGCHCDLEEGMKPDD